MPVLQCRVKRLALRGSAYPGTGGNFLALSEVLELAGAVVASRTATKSRKRMYRAQQKSLLEGLLSENTSATTLRGTGRPFE